jgi:hypothetical protein
MTTVYKYNKFDFSKISFSKPNETRNGSKYINLHYPNNEEWYLQTPKSRIPFNPYPTNFCISISDSFEKILDKLDEVIIKEAVKESFHWFGVIKTEKEIRALYNKLSIPSKDQNYQPFMRINFTNEPDIYNQQNEIIPKEEIVQGNQVRLIIKLRKIYINSSKNFQFRLLVDLEQLKIAKPKEDNIKQKQYAFIDSD